MVNIEQTKEWAQAANDIYNMPFSPTNIKYQIKGLQTIRDVMLENMEDGLLQSIIVDTSYETPSFQDYFSFFNHGYTCAMTRAASAVMYDEAWNKISTFLSDESEEYKYRQKCYNVLCSGKILFDDETYNLQLLRRKGYELDHIDNDILRFYKYLCTFKNEMMLIYKLRANYTAALRIPIKDYLAFYLLFFTVFGAYENLYNKAITMGIIHSSRQTVRKSQESLNAFIDRCNEEERKFNEANPCREIDVSSPDLSELEFRILNYLSGINGEVSSLTGIESFRYETKYDIAIACRQLKYSKFIIAFIDGNYGTGDIEASALEITDVGRNVLKRCSSNKLQNDSKANELVKQDVIPDSFVVSEDTLNLMPEMILSFHKVPGQRTMQYYYKTKLLYKLHKTFELVPASDYVTITNIYSQFINQQNEYIITTPSFVNYILPYIIDCPQDKLSAVQQGINRQIKKPDNEKIARRVRELMESCIR